MPPSDPEEYEQWLEYQESKYDYSIELGKQEIRKYFDASLKPSNRVLNDNVDFFNSLGDIEKVVVLGHSLAEVDLPYFKNIIKTLNGCQKWVVSYYAEEEKENRIETMCNLGVDKSNIELTKISDLKL